MDNNKMVCEQCGEKIEIGEEYVYVNITGYNVHEWCEDEYFKEIQKNETVHYIRGEEEE